jgi:hypothetical protein
MKVQQAKDSKNQYKIMMTKACKKSYKSASKKIFGIKCTATAHGTPARVYSFYF